jgi:riboflavin synthase
MFTGIIEELGKVRRIARQGRVARLEIEAVKVSADSKIGDSIAVNGACLTLVKKEDGLLIFEAMEETLKVTNLCSLKIHEKVNLERSLKVVDRISGHFVSGHVDCAGIIRSKAYRSNNLCFEIAVPQQFMRYCLPKGSIAVDGISLTLVATKSNTFSIYIIPHTLKNTTLGFKGPSDKVNVEFDLLAKLNEQKTYATKVT